MTQIFLSHASANAAFAIAICEALEAEGHRCWVASRDIVPGKRYADSIAEAVDGCELLLLILSSFANDSSHVMREVERAASNGKELLTVRIEKVEPAKGLSYFVQAHQWLEVAGIGSDQIASHVVRVMQARGVSSLEARSREERRPGPGAVAPDEVDGHTTLFGTVSRWTWGIAVVVVLTLLWATSTFLPDAAERQTNAEASLSALRASVGTYVTSIQDALRKPAPGFPDGVDSEIDQQRDALSAIQEQLPATLQQWRGFATELDRMQVREAGDVELMEQRFTALSSGTIGERSLDEALTWSDSALLTIERLAGASEVREKERLTLQGVLSERVVDFEAALAAVHREEPMLAEWNERERLEELAGAAEATLEKLRETKLRLSRSTYPDDRLLAEIQERIREINLESGERELGRLAEALSDYGEWASEVGKARGDDRRDILRKGASVGRGLVSVMKQAQSGYEIAEGIPGHEEFTEKYQALRRIREDLQARARRLRSQLAKVDTAEALTQAEHEELSSATRAALDEVDQALSAVAHDANELTAAIEELAGRALIMLIRDNELRAKADEEVQWALGVEGDEVIWIDGSDRHGLVTKRHPGHNEVGTQLVGVTFKSGGYTEVQVCAICAKFTERAVKVRMRVNGDRAVQSYTILPNDTELLNQKRRVIQQALAADLNTRIAGLQLMPEDIKVSWPRSPERVPYKPQLTEFLTEGFNFSIPQLTVPSRLSGKASDGTRGDLVWTAEIQALEEYLETLDL